MSTAICRQDHARSAVTYTAALRNVTLPLTVWFVMSPTWISAVVLSLERIAYVAICGCFRHCSRRCTRGNAPIA